MHKLGSCHRACCHRLSHVHCSRKKKWFDKKCSSSWMVENIWLNLSLGHCFTLWFSLSPSLPSLTVTIIIVRKDMLLSGLVEHHLAHVGFHYRYGLHMTNFLRYAPASPIITILMYTSSLKLGEYYNLPRAMTNWGRFQPTMTKVRCAS